MVFYRPQQNEDCYHKGYNVPVPSCQNLIVGPKHRVRAHVHPLSYHTAHIAHIYLCWMRRCRNDSMIRLSQFSGAPSNFQTHKRTSPRPKLPGYQNRWNDLINQNDVQNITEEAILCRSRRGLAARSLPVLYGSLAPRRTSGTEI